MKRKLEQFKMALESGMIDALYGPMGLMRDPYVQNMLEVYAWLKIKIFGLEDESL
jgi:hypothetical protein